MGMAANALSRHGGCSVPHTLTEAAAAVGKNRTTVLRAIKSGKLSATRDSVSGDWLIEPAELFRLYQPGTHAMAQAPNALSRQGDLSAEISNLRTKLEVTEARLHDAHEQIADLRAQRDAEAEERRRLTAVLADMRVVPSTAPPRRSWWRWRR
jgi:hypothetical protein